MTYFKRLLLLAIILFSCVGCDQITKAAAKSYLAPSQPISYFGDIFRLHYTENTGAFLGLGSTLPPVLRFWVTTIMTGFALAGMSVFILFNRNLRPALTAGISLIIGGGIGNLIDRIFNNGAVIDFMNIGVGSLRTGIFNIADVAIMIGEGMLFFLFFLRKGFLEDAL